jgi:plastocyanin
MKNTLLSAFFTLISVVAFSTTVTISNSGTTFTPSTVTIKVGDTISFQIASMHNALEVSQSTWTANGNTPLPGFEVGFGGGTVTGLTAGTHYYVCAPHASVGMKGQIIVNTATGIDNLIPSSDNISIYPNPTTGKFVVQYKGITTQNSNSASLEVYNLKGEQICSLPILSEQTSVDLSDLTSGSYFVRINDNEKTYSKILVKQ